MRKTHRPRSLAVRAVIAGVSAMLACAFVPGCQHKDEAPNAPGYYSGPLRPKPSAKSPDTAGGGNAAPKAGQP